MGSVSREGICLFLNALAFSAFPFDLKQTGLIDLNQRKSMIILKTFDTYHFEKPTKVLF